MSNTSALPAITAVQWLSASEVLGGEASHFTPWLQQPESMEILGAALKLEELTAVAAEHNVLGKRLDILATALDENGDEVTVCIENQYGVSDADHLGRLIAYLAQNERGRAVWVVEQAHDAFVAAVRFLNRTSTEDVGYYLVQVRFTHGLAGGFQVHFEVLAAPIAWERSGARRSVTRAANQPKIAYLEQIHEAVKPTLLAAGFTSMNTHPRGAYLWVRWPQDLWYTRYAKRLDIRVTRNVTSVVLYAVAFPSREGNTEAISILEKRFDGPLRDQLPPGSLVHWHGATATAGRDLVRVELPGSGYEQGDPAISAEWSATVVQLWLNLLRSHPIPDLADQVQRALPGEEITLEEDELEDEEEPE